MKKKKYTMQLALNETDEVFTIQDREFYAKPLVIDDVMALENVTDADSQAAFLARVLTDRSVDGEAVEAAWLNSTISRVDAVQLGYLLINGEAAPKN